MIHYTNLPIFLILILASGGISSTSSSSSTLKTADTARDGGFTTGGALSAFVCKREGTHQLISGEKKIILDKCVMIEPYQSTKFDLY